MNTTPETRDGKAPTTSAARVTQPPASRQAVLTLAALGVVYGDIGTSPLYTVKEIFRQTR